MHKEQHSVVFKFGDLSTLTITDTTGLLTFIRTKRCMCQQGKRCRGAIEFLSDILPLTILRLVHESYAATPSYSKYRRLTARIVRVFGFVMRECMNPLISRLHHWPRQWDLSGGSDWNGLLG